MKKKIVDYIQVEFIKEEGETLSTDEDLLGGGILDSLGIMKLISYLEREFEIQIPPKDMVIENFIDVNAMCQYITEKKKA